MNSHVEQKVNNRQEMAAFAKDPKNIGGTVILNNVRYTLLQPGIPRKGVNDTIYWLQAYDHPPIPSVWKDINGFNIHMNYDG